MAKTSPPPWQTSEAIRQQLDIKNYVFAWNNGGPVWVSLNGTDDIFLPVFSTVEMLHAMFDDMDITIDIKKIDDQYGFLASVPLTIEGTEQRIRVILNPQRTNRGTTRFTEIVRG